MNLNSNVSSTSTPNRDENIDWAHKSPIAVPCLISNAPRCYAIPMNPRGWPLVVCLSVLLTNHGLTASSPQPLGKRLLLPFDYQGVTLEPGPLKEQMEEVKRFYLSIPDDDLLKGFRARAGRSAPGKDLGGWYSSDTFLVFGQIVSGLARLHAATGDAACRDKANRLVSEWARCIEPDGYFYASRKPNAPHYIYDKMLWGLLDSYLYCGNREALPALSRITDWAVKNLDRSRRINDTSTEWYTLSENLYRAYLITGDAKYRDFAQVWEYHDYWDIYARKGDIFGPRPDGGRTDVYHAYSHVNTLGGAGAAFLVKGELDYLKTIVNAADYLQRVQCFATGGFGPDEQLLPPAKLLEKLNDTHNTFETQCGSWAVFKLAKYLISFTGEASYGDWVERLILNGIGASIPMTIDGRVFYYSDYCLSGGAKRNTDFGWSCCTGTRPQAVADCADLIYFHDPENLYVNLFTPSTVNWARAKGAVTLSQTTEFPESQEVRFTVTVAKPAEFGVKFRQPGWLAAPMSATVNGRAVKCASDEKHWVALRRVWRSGDELKLRLPMGLHAASLDPQRNTPAAALFGPVVLAFAAPNARALAAVDVSSLAQVLNQSEHRLAFTLSSDRNIQARPFSSFRQGERYYVYLDPKMGARISYQDVQFTGKWNNAGVFRYCNEVGATAECQFDGTGVRWLGRRFDDAGRAEITIDGQAIATVDQYGPGRDLPFDWRHQGLRPGNHTIRLRLLPEKPDKSSDRFLNVIGFEALNSQ
jgi:DUF1680 family protein